MTIPPKKVINSNPGDADHVGGNDWDDLADAMNNVDKTGPIKWNTRTYFRSGKLELRNPADTFSYIIVGSALAADRTITEPLLTSNDERVYKAFAQTLSNKTLDATCDVSAATGGSVTDAQYVTLATHAGLSAERTLAVGDGLTLTDAGANGAATINGDIIDRATKRIQIFDDFFGVGDFTTTDSNSSVWRIKLSGTAAQTSSLSISSSGYFGLWEMNTGTDTTGTAGILLGNEPNSFHLGTGIATFQARIQIPTLSAVGEEFDFRIGFLDITTGAGTDGVYFLYDRNTSANWIKVTNSNATSTVTASSTAVGTGFVNLKIVVNAAGTSAEFFVDGSTIGTLATNIPVGSGRATSLASSIIKSAGTTARTAIMEYIAMDIDLTTPR